jgi:hypothetical protein
MSRPCQASHTRVRLRRAAARSTRPQGRPGYQADHLVGIMSPVRWGRTVAAAAQMATAARLVPGGAWSARRARTGPSYGSRR